MEHSAKQETIQAHQRRVKEIDQLLDLLVQMRSPANEDAYITMRRNYEAERAEVLDTCTPASGRCAEHSLVDDRRVPSTEG